MFSSLLGFQGSSLQLQQVAGETRKMGKPEEEEEDDDPGPVDTKPECEATCKPRCVKQLLAYEVSIWL